MVWRHPDIAIDDPRPFVGSFNMADVRRLSAHVIKLRDMPEGVLVLSGLSRIWKSRVCDPVLQGDNGNVMGIHDFLCLPEWIGAEGHVAKRTRSALAQSFGSTTRPSMFVGDDDESDDDDDACVEIPLVTPLRSAAMIPSSGNEGRSSAAPTAEGSNPQGKGVMVDDVVASSAGASRSRPSSGPAPSFRNVSGDAIHTNFFPFSVGLYYATYPMDGVARNCEFTREEWDAPYRPTFRVLSKEVFKDPSVCKTIVDQLPTPGEMVRVESLSDDQLTAKMSVLHCMMMSHGGELLARYRGLNQSHHEYVLSTDSRLKGYEEKVASLTGLELQVSALKKQVSGLNDKLSSFDASFAKSKAKGKERKKKIKSLTKRVDNLHSEVGRLFASLNQATVLEAEKDEEILRLKTTPPEFQGELLSLATSAGFEHGLSMHQTKDEFAVMLKKMANFMPGAQDRLAEASRLIEPKKLVHPTNVPASREVRVSPSTKESTVTPASKSLELSTNVNFTASAVASEHNEEIVNVEVDGLDPKMTDDTATVKSRHAFVQGISISLDDVMQLVEVGLGRVSSGPNDYVVALSAHEKGDGLDPSSVAGEEAAANPSGV
ncbi:hypothetical protein Tco_1388583 [Tanacetum coccineum]